MENNGFTNHPYCNPYRRNFPLLAENPLIYLDLSLIHILMVVALMLLVEAPHLRKRELAG